MLITEGPPRTFDAWRHCITHECGIALTPEYRRQRSRALRDGNDFRTARFIELYGADHLQRVIGWLSAPPLNLRRRVNDERITAMPARARGKLRGLLALEAIFRPEANVLNSGVHWLRSSAPEVQRRCALGLYRRYGSPKPAAMSLS